jgi:hypothetical protein
MEKSSKRPPPKPLSEGMIYRPAGSLSSGGKACDSFGP